DVIVIYGNFTDNYTIHAGRQDSGGITPSLHIAGPPSVLSPVPEHGPNSSPSSSGSPSSVTAGFILALMSSPRSDKAWWCWPYRMLDGFTALGSFPAAVWRSNRHGGAGRTGCSMASRHWEVSRRLCGDQTG
ncbi:hypothetical protein Vretifemale_8793, partial [Volvox reticuliferus]